MPEPLNLAPLCAVCPYRIEPIKRKNGRPPAEPLADPKAVAHFREWLAKQPNGLGEPATFFCDSYLGTQYGPPLKIHHLRKALDGSRPYYEAELKKVVAYAIEQMKYTGYTLPPV